MNAAIQNTNLTDSLERGMLRFITAGSVDDGKSTLIGRLLFDSKGIFADQLDAMSRSKHKRTVGDTVDLSLLTDGLEAEREQGITIDVAYRYFATPKRKFILCRQRCNPFPAPSRWSSISWPPAFRRRRPTTQKRGWT